MRPWLSGLARHPEVFPPEARGLDCLQARLEASLVDLVRATRTERHLHTRLLRRLEQAGVMPRRRTWLQNSVASPSGGVRPKSISGILSFEACVTSSSNSPSASDTRPAGGDASSGSI